MTHIPVYLLAVALVGLLGVHEFQSHELLMQMAKSCNSTQTAQQELLGAMLPDMRKHP